MERKDFSKFLTDVYSHGALMSAIGIGHDLGLFRVFYETDEPQSVQDIATKLNLKERYTKEWLSCMVVSGIIHQDRNTDLFTMPESHKEELKVRAPFAPILAVMGKRNDLVKNCFHIGGPYGFGYDEDKHYFTWNEDSKRQSADDILDKGVIPVIKQQGLISKLESGISVLDIGCGTASITQGLANRFPKSQFLGIEYDDFALEIASENTRDLANITVMKGDVENLQDFYDNQFDFIFMYDVIHDLPRPHKALEEIYKVLKKDGSFTMVDCGFHSNPLDNVGSKTASMYYAIGMFICLPASMQSEPHIGYGPCWGIEEMEKALKRAKFDVSNVVKDNHVYFHCTK